MMIRELLLVILLFIGPMVASGDSAGEDNSCSDQVVQSPNTAIEAKGDETAILPLKALPQEKEKPCPDSAVLQCPNTTIKGKVGETVTLPCSTKNKTDISNEQVEWLFEDPTGEDILIHSYVRGKELKDLSKNFRNRTSLLGNQSSGNCSLRLVVAKFDSGTYHCSVPDHVCCPVTLKVLPKGEDDSSRDPDKPPSTDRQNNIIGGAVGGVLGVAALILIIISLVYCYREQLMNFCCRKNANTTHQRVSYQRAQQPPQNQGNEPVDQNPEEKQNQMLENQDQDDPADGNEPAAGN